MDEIGCRKELTTYKAYTLHKSIPLTSKDKPTWARITIDEERLDHDELVKAVDKLNNVKNDKQYKSVTEKKQGLKPNQSEQVTKLLDDLALREKDYNFEWTLAQISSKISNPKKSGVKPETLAMTVYFKRAPVKNANVTSLYQQDIERRLMREQDRRTREHNQRLEEQIREQQRLSQMQAQAQAQAHAQAQQHQQLHNQPRGGPQIITLNNERGRQGGRGRSSSGSRSRSGGRGRKHKDHKKADKRYDSGSDYDSDDSWYTDFSSNDTSISSRRTRRSDKYHKKDKLPKERATKYHQKKHYNIEVPRSPRQMMHDRLSSVVEVPPPPIGRPDVVKAAYQAGLRDADTEHYELERIRADRADRQLVARERDMVYDDVPRYVPSLHDEAYSRRTIVEVPMPLNRMPPRRASGLEPRGVVSYAAEESHRRPPHPARIYSEGPRYTERRDGREVYDDDRMYRQERSAHDYIDGSRAQPHMGTRTTTYRRPLFEPVLHQGHPFAHRRDDGYR